MGVKNLDLASFLRREKPYSQNQCIKAKIELARLALQSVRDLYGTIGYDENVITGSLAQARTFAI